MKKTEVLKLLTDVRYNLQDTRSYLNDDFDSVNAQKAALRRLYLVRARLAQLIEHLEQGHVEQFLQDCVDSLEGKQREQSAKG